jgi:predicted nucleotidyltransferase
MLSEYLKNQIKERLLSEFNPEKIILFGSQARGTADNKSDIDILVISCLTKDRFLMMNEMSSRLIKLNYAFDVIILTAEEFEKNKKYPGTIARYANKEGVVLYER